MLHGISMQFCSMVSLTDEALEALDSQLYIRMEILFLKGILHGGE